MALAFRQKASKFFSRLEWDLEAGRDARELSVLVCYSVGVAEIELRVQFAIRLGLPNLNCESSLLFGLDCRT